MFNVSGTFPLDLANVIKNFQKIVHIFFRLQNYCILVPEYCTSQKSFSIKSTKSWRNRNFKLPFSIKEAFLWRKVFLLAAVFDYRGAYTDCNDVFQPSR